MKKLEDISAAAYILIQNDEECYIDVLTKEDFMKSEYYLKKDKNNKLFLATAEYARFSLYNALLDLKMYEDWAEDVINYMTDDVVKRIESEINKYLKEIPEFYASEKIEW